MRVPELVTAQSATADAPKSVTVGYLSPDFLAEIRKRPMPEPPGRGKPGGKFFALHFNKHSFADLKAMAQCFGYSVRDFLHMKIDGTIIASDIGFLPGDALKMSRAERAEVARRYQMACDVHSWKYS